MKRVALLGVISMSLILVSCWAEESPSDVVRAWSQAMNKDFSASLNYIVSDERAQVRADAEKSASQAGRTLSSLIAEYGPWTVAIVQEEVRGDTATVIANVTSRSGTTRNRIPLRKEEGKWRIRVKGIEEVKDGASAAQATPTRIPSPTPTKPPILPPTPRPTPRTAASPTPLPPAKGPLTIINPKWSLSNFRIYDEHRSPRKGDLVFLLTGKEGVRVSGPPFSSRMISVELDRIFYSENPAMLPLRGSEEKGFMVRFNEHLSYKIVINDFEDEIDLAQVDLRKEPQEISSEFIFVAQGGGILTLRIAALWDGRTVAVSSPVRVEVRPTREPGVISPPP